MKIFVKDRQNITHHHRTFLINWSDAGGLWPPDLLVILKRCLMTFVFVLEAQAYVLGEWELCCSFLVKRDCWIFETRCSTERRLE